MQFNKLSTIQLHRLAQNKAHLRLIRQGAKEELNKRVLTPEELHLLSAEDALALENARKPLHPGLKLLAVVLPLPVVIHAAVAAWYLGKGEVLRWRQYWLFMLLGICLWATTVIISFSF